MTFQNIFSSMADFRAVVSVLPCSLTNKSKKNLCGCAEKANRQWAFVAFWLSSYVNIKTAAAFANWLAPKKDALFSLIYFFGSFCIYYIPHNFVIPQAMPHAIPQTDSALYPHRLSTEFMLNHPVTCGREQQERHHYQPIPRRPCSSKSRFFLWHNDCIFQL